MAELQQKPATAFVGLAHIPPFGEVGALEELERAIREYGLKGRPASPDVVQGQVSRRSRVLGLLP